MKKLLVLMMAMAMVLSLAACGGEEPSTEPGPDSEPSASAPDDVESIDLVEVTGNGISLLLLSDIGYAMTNESNGAMLFADDESNTVITLGILTDEPQVTTEHITDEVLLLTLGSGMSDATLESTATIEHESGISVVGFGKVTMNDVEMNSVVQYFFPADGGYLVISYLYVADAGSSLDDTIEQVVTSVEAAE